MNKYKQQAQELRKARIEKRMCLDKKAFDTKESAFQKGSLVYQCKFCKKWHRSSQIGKLIKYLKFKSSRERENRQTINH